MARRNLVDIDRRILKAVHKIGSEEGIKGVTSKKVAALVGVSHFTCFEHFETRQGMLDAAALYIEKQYFDILFEVFLFPSVSSFFLSLSLCHFNLSHPSHSHVYL